jgi:TatA/E family protein of Tat protein translocase
MFGLQPGHIIIIIVVATLFFVPSRLPEFVRALRKVVPEFRNGMKDGETDKSKDETAPKQ